MNKNYCVYMHTCPNGKVYIGITKQPPMKRWKGGSGYKYNAHFYSAIKKYGWNNIRHEVLYENLVQDEACSIEEFLIAYFHSTDREYGYNHSTGGERNFTFKHTEEAKKKMSKAKSKTVFQFDIDSGKIVAIYESAKQASLLTGINKISIQCVCNGQRKSAGGYKWQYADTSMQTKYI